VTLDVGQTLRKQPEGGWQEIFDPHEIAIRHQGIVVTLDAVSGTEAKWMGIEAMRLVRAGKRPA